VGDDVGTLVGIAVGLNVGERVSAQIVQTTLTAKKLSEARLYPEVLNTCHLPLYGGIAFPGVPAIAK
jgi:hypothetical protein